MYNWTVPNISYPDPLAREHCVFRIRYNISMVEETNLGWENDTSVGPSDDWSKNAIVEGDPSLIPIWSKYGLSQPMQAFSNYSGAKDAYNVGHGYVMGDNPWVDIFGSFIAPKHVYLQLAHDSTTMGKVSQDRTHTFAVRDLPQGLEGYTIHNLGVQGKRGNIVQTFPGTEYDFFPMRLWVTAGDLIHIQWNGANTNPRGNAGEGPAGFDRSNMLVMKGILYYEAGQELQTFSNIGHWSQSYPAYIDPQSTNQFLGLSYDDAVLLSLGPLYSGYFDLGIRQIGTGTTLPAAYHYMSTRNNNFTNRSQKGKVVVNPSNTTVPLVPAAVMEQFHPKTEIGWARVTFTFDERRQGQYNIRLSAAGQSSAATDWVLVQPRYLSVPDGGAIYLKIDHPWVPFTYGRIYWTDDKSVEPIEIYTVVEKWSWSGTGTAAAKISLGGYFRVQNVINGSAIGGTVFAFVMAGICAYWMYKRFGCRCFNKTDPTGQKEGLLASGAPSSEGPANAGPAVAAAPAVAPTTTENV
jgi:hypothetical protein